MSFFNDASIVQIPSGYKASTLYSIKPSSGAGDFSVTRNTTATRVNENGLIESVAANVPRIDYLNGSCGELLVEPQRTNLLRYSEEFDNGAWAKANGGSAAAPIVTANAGTAPDGTTTADRVQFSTVGSTSLDRSILRQNVTTSAVDNSLSFYVKLNSGTSPVTMAFHFNNFISNTFSVTDEWTKVTMSDTALVVATNFGIMLQGNVTALSADVLVWGAQLEAGSYATSYIPTVASTVTRNADVISKTSIASLLGDSEGALFVEASVFDTSIPHGISISDGTANNRFSLIIPRGTGNLGLDSSVSGVIESGISGSSISANVIYKIAASYAVNDVVLYLDGSSQGTDTSYPSFSDGTLTRFGLDTGAGGQNFYGRIRQLVVFDQALLDEELSSIAAYASFTEIANANNYTING